jgi:hypothetical protein
MKKLVSMSVLVVGLGLAACGDESINRAGHDGLDAAHSGPICTAAKSLCVQLSVPDDYEGTPRQLIMGLFDRLPPVGPPAGVLALIDSPRIGVGFPLDIKVEDIAQSGEYFIYAALYNQGGGMFVPEPGIDYTAQSPAKVSVGRDPVNLADMTLAVLD